MSNPRCVSRAEKVAADAAGAAVAIPQVTIAPSRTIRRRAASKRAFMGCLPFSNHHGAAGAVPGGNVAPSRSARRSPADISTRGEIATASRSVFLDRLAALCPAGSGSVSWKDRHGGSGRGSGGECGQIEPRPLERPTETHVAPVHHPDDGGDHLGLRARVLGDRIHEIEERDVPFHCRYPPPWTRSQVRCQTRAKGSDGAASSSPPPPASEVVERPGYGP